MSHKDYYDILGVKRSASPEELKRAYRTLAQQYHPDKGGDQERFKEVNEAYQVLSDPNKRAQYDQFGEAGINNNSGFGGGNVRYEDIFSGSRTGFGGGGGLGDIFETFFGAAFAQVQVEIQIKLTQALLGGNINLQTNQGEKLELKLPPGTQDGQAFRFAGKGMPHRNGRGDLIIVARIQYPKRITKEQKIIIEKLQESGL